MARGDLLVFLVKGIARLLFVGNRTRIRQAWSEAAISLGLELDEGDDIAIRGDLRGLHVSAALIEVLDESNNPDVATVIQVSARGRLDPSLTMRRVSTLEFTDATGVEDDLRCGDAAFDESMYLEGDEAAALAALNFDARRTLHELAKRRSVYVEEGSVTFRQHTVVRDAPTLQELIAAMAALAEKMATAPAARPAALARNAAEDTVREVRLRNFLALAKHYPRDPRTEQTAAAVSRDVLSPRPERAATPEGPPVLVALAGMVEDRLLDSELRIDALGLVLRDYAESAAPVLQAVLATDAEPIVHEALDAIARLQQTSLLGPVCELAAVARPVTAQIAARALGALGDARAEPALIAMLANTSTDVRLAAIGALGKLGTVRCIEALLPLAKGGLLQSAELAEAAQEAVRRVQERLGDVDAGRLSLAAEAGSAGRLSLGGDAGALSEADDETRGERPDDPPGKSRDPG